MTQRLYLVGVPEQSSESEQDRLAADIESSGLIEQGGIATEKIAADEDDISRQGRYQLGDRWATKLERELESLAESTYTALPYFDPDRQDRGRRKGYYELERATVNPANPASDGVFEYDIGLTKRGTRANDFRAVTTKAETVQTGLATGADAPIGVPVEASVVRWFDPAAGTELATPSDTVTAEYGTIDRYTPADSTFEDPTLLYDLAYMHEGRTDVRVFDDKNREKFYSFTSGGGFQYDSEQFDTVTYNDDVRKNQWVHIFHTAHEFDGLPVVDNGLLRIRFDDPHGTLEAFEYDCGWGVVPIEQGSYVLEDADIERVGPAVVDVYTEWRDTSDDVLEAAVLSIQRGLSGAIVRQADNDTLSAGLESVLEPFASEHATDPRPTQTLKSREDAK